MRPKVGIMTGGEPMADVAAIAAGLTKAQREKLLWLPADGSARAHGKGAETSLYCMAEIVKGDPNRELATCARLCKSAGRTEPTKSRIWGDTLWQATPLGLLVRAHLLANQTKGNQHG